MYFRNEHHRQAFRDGMKKTNRKDKEILSAVYLLSAEPCLWRRAKQASVCGKILLNNVRLTEITENGYILLGAATEKIDDYIDYEKYAQDFLEENGGAYTKYGDVVYLRNDQTLSEILGENEIKMGGI